MRAFLVLPSLLLAAACSGGGATDPGGGGGGGPTVQRTVDTVFVAGTSFAPSSLTVQRGRSIVFMNTDPITHTITPSGHTAWQRVQSAAPGEMLRITLNTAGTYNYLCEPHASAGMTGTIVVQ